MYEEHFGTDWETLADREEIVKRAFALGVATRLGEHHSGELERLTDAVETTYERSFVDLAYQKGQEEAGVATRNGSEDDTQIWSTLVESKTEPIEPDRDGRERSTDTDEIEGSGLPEALAAINIDSRPADTTAIVSRPEFLERTQSQRRQTDTSERTMFGRKRRQPDREEDDQSQLEANNDDGADTEDDHDHDRKER